MKAREAVQDRTLLLQSLLVLAAVILAFVFAQPLHLENGTIAMFGAAVLMLLDVHGHHAQVQSERVTRAFSEIEWITIFFFIGLFIVVHGLQASGVLRRLAQFLVPTTGDELAFAPSPPLSL